MNNTTVTQWGPHTLVPFRQIERNPWLVNVYVSWFWESPEDSTLEGRSFRCAWQSAPAVRSKWNNTCADRQDLQPRILECPRSSLHTRSNWRTRYQLFQAAQALVLRYGEI